jgi:hypothetical protein
MPRDDGKAISKLLEPAAQMSKVEKKLRSSEETGFLMIF